MLNIILAVIIMAVAVGFIGIRIFFINKMKKENKGYIIIPVSSDTEKLTGLVTGYYMEEMFENENMCRKIILVKMDGSLNGIIADRLANKYSIVESIALNRLEDFISNQEKKRKKI